ncbi:MAG TPA: MFS transporter [Gaiellaceae bacterium]|nr:MFS transporter [Gaiellaceae bacterium]
MAATIALPAVVTGDGYRWVVLAAGTLAQASYSAIALGLSVMLPELRRRYGLTLGEAGIVLAAPNMGSMLSLLPWGLAADRIGERAVVATGLAAAAASLYAAGRTASFVPLAALLAAAGLVGASVNAASGRAVMHWFGARQRGLALGIRQTAIPIGGATVALGLPHVLDAGGTRLGLTVVAIGCLGGAVLAAALLRERPAVARDEPTVDARPLRDRRIWKLLGGSALLLFPQTAVFGYTVLFLHERRGLSPAAAAGVLAAIQVLGIGARIGGGRWSDVVESRIAPLRWIAAASATLAAATGACVGAPLVLLVPVLIAGGVLAMSWNGLSFAAAAELAGRARAGASLGLQQTVLAIGGAGLPPAFAALVGALGWGWAWGLAAVGPAAGLVVLRGLRA